MMKRVLILLCVLGMICGCSNGGDSSGTKSADNTKPGDTGKTSGATTPNTVTDPSKPGNPPGKPGNGKSAVTKTTLKNGDIKEVTKTKYGEASWVHNAKGQGKMLTYNVHGQAMTTETETNFDINALGIKDYPGSKVAGKVTGLMKITAPGGEAYSISRLTTDSPKQVIDFYSKMVKVDNSTVKDDQGNLKGRLPSGDDVMVKMAPSKKDPKQFEVTITVTKLDAEARKKREKKEADKIAKVKEAQKNSTHMNPKAINPGGGPPKMVPPVGGGH